jgi:diadenosine tetraphosphate (Ap4A) HIT family hydrolase
MDTNHCIFCDYLKSSKIIMENELAFAIYDIFPVNKGHVLVMPKRHFANF